MSKDTTGSGSGTTPATAQFCAARASSRAGLPSFLVTSGQKVCAIDADPINPLFAIVRGLNAQLLDLVQVGWWTGIGPIRFGGPLRKRATEPSSSTPAGTAFLPCGRTRPNHAHSHPDQWRRDAERCLARLQNAR